MSRVLYISNAGLPIDAAGIRIEQIGTLLEILNCQVHYICNRRIGLTEKDSGYKMISSMDGLELNSNEIHFSSGNKIYSYLLPFRGGKINSLREFIEIITAKRAFKRVKRYCEQEKAKIIILYNDTYGLTKKLIRYCNKKEIKLIADVSEWYEKNSNASIARRIVIWLSDKRIKKLDHKLDGIIAISQYFEAYYRNRGVRCVWIPPLMKIPKEIIPSKYNYNTKKSIINIIYAGFPGNKDILFPFVEAVIEKNMIDERLRFDILGIDKDYLINNGIQDAEKYGVHAHGRMSHEETLNYIKKADFGILFRRNERYAKAGFSTKFAECMSFGVPMICNRVGGADSLIVNMKNGLLIESIEKKELHELLERVIQMTPNQIKSLKEAAYLDAKKYFDGKQSLNKLKKIICGAS